MRSKFGIAPLNFPMLQKQVSGSAPFQRLSMSISLGLCDVAENEVLYVFVTFFNIGVEPPLGRSIANAWPKKNRNS